MYTKTPYTALALVLVLATPCAFAEKITNEKITRMLRHYNEASTTQLPVPSTQQLEALLSGEMVDLQERTPIVNTAGKSQDKIRIVGFQLIERPHLLVWLAALNASTQHNKRLAEHQIDTNNAGGSIWYQHLDTPWPVRNRHWVINNEKNTQLAEDMTETVWEHTWQLAEQGRETALNLVLNEQVEGVKKQQAKSTIYLNVNRGAWTMFAVNDNVTLVAAHTTADMGGWIPDAWVAKFVSRQLSGVLKSLTAKADTAHIDYTAEQLVFTGSGLPISSEDAVKAQWQYQQGLKRSTDTPANNRQ